MNFAKFLRTRFLQNTSGWLLLNLTIISTFNPNNPKAYNLIKIGHYTLVQTKVNDHIKDIRLIHEKWQLPNLKRILTFFAIQTSGVFQCTDNICQCCQHLIIQSCFTLKNISKQFFLKNRLSCDSRNLIYVAKYPTCKEENIGETGIGESRLRDRVKIHWQHIQQTR